MPRIVNDTEAKITSYLHAVSSRNKSPVSATFEITSRCNFNCKMCYIHDCNCTAADELSTAQWLDIAKQSFDMGVLFVLFTGGEPLLRDDFEELYTKIKNMGMLVSINTNGSLLSGKKLEILKKNPPTRINISLYGASNETYKSLTGSESFDKVLYNIKEAKKAGLPIKINHTVTPYNAADMKEIVGIANGLELYVKSTAYMYPPVRRDSGLCGANDARFSPQEAAYYRTEFDYLKLGKEKFMERAEKIKNGIEQFENECLEIAPDGKNDGVLCRAGSSSFWINYKGEMSQCGIFSNKMHNVIDEGVKNAWDKLYYETKQIRLPTRCLNCKYRLICNVCAAVCFSETGEFSEIPEYVCEYSKHTVRYYLEKYEKMTNN